MLSSMITQIGRAAAMLPRLALLLLVMAACPLWAATPQESFSAARDAYEARDEAALAAYSNRLYQENYPLAPYVDYWRMLLRLDRAETQEVREFLARHAELPFAERVRVEWLRKLGRRQDWKTFFEEYPHLAVEDTALTCLALDGRIQQGDEGALGLGRAIWHTAKDQPATCDPVFERMRNRGVLTTEDVWARVRLLLEQNQATLAKSVLQRQLKLDAVSLKWLGKVYENPQRALEKRTYSTQTRYGRTLNLYALQRVARTQPALALQLWQQIKGAFSTAEQRYQWGRMAFHAARMHDPLAQEWFDNAMDAPLDAEQLAWKARAALRAGRWDTLQETIAAMPVDLQQQPAWRYWNGRALKERGQIAAANAVLLPLARERSYHGLLAGEELGDIIGAPDVAYKPGREEFAAVQEIPAIRRALELQRLGMRWEARREWNVAVEGLDDKQLLAAAEVAQREAWFDAAINTAEKTRFTHDFSLRYPTPYRDLMQSYARENALDEAWVYGLIRQESRFVTQARSSAGASGLMQLMPNTAKWIAKRLGMDNFNQGMVNSIDTNIRFGTHYLRYALDRMDGQTLMATAAYNAGPGRPRRWLDARPLEGAIYAETIPFGETRDYVQKVMGNAHFYAYQLAVRMQPLKLRLGMMPAFPPPVSQVDGQDALTPP